MEIMTADELRGIKQANKRNAEVKSMICKVQDKIMSSDDNIAQVFDCDFYVKGAEMKFVDEVYKLGYNVKTIQLDQIDRKRLYQISI